MSEAADDARAELRAVRARLLDLHGDEGDVEQELLQRTERAIATAVAALAPSRDAGAPAREAAVAGAAPRSALPLARDLLITVDLLLHGFA